MPESPKENPDFLLARRNMVEHQTRSRGVRDKRVLDAMMTIPREQFLPPDQGHSAVTDCAAGGFRWIANRVGPAADPTLSAHHGSGYTFFITLRVITPTRETALALPGATGLAVSSPHGGFNE